MVGMLGYVIIAGFTPFLSAVCSGFLFSSGKMKGSSKWFLAASVGLMFAVATLELIPEAIEAALNQKTSSLSHQKKEAEFLIGADHQTEQPSTSKLQPPLFGLAMGFFLMLVLEYVMEAMGIGHSHSHSHSRHTSRSRPDSQNLEDPEDGETVASMLTVSHANSTSKQLSSLKLQIITFSGLAAHSLIDGLMIAAAWHAGETVGSHVTLALILHKIPDGFLLSSLLIRSGEQEVVPTTIGGGSNRHGNWSWIIGVCLMTPFGAFLGINLFKYFGLSESSLSFCLGGGAGTFLFLSCYAILPEVMRDPDIPNEEPSKFNRLMTILLGFLCYSLYSCYFHSH